MKLDQRKSRKLLVVEHKLLDDQFHIKRLENMLNYEKKAVMKFRPFLKFNTI